LRDPELMKTEKGRNGDAASKACKIERK